MATKTIHNVLEGVTFEHQFTIVDEDDVAIPDANLDALTLTYYDCDTGDAINDREDQDVLDDNDVAVVNGVVTWSGQTEDSAIVTTSKDYEIHVALWEFTYETSKKGKHETFIRVKNLSKVS